MELQRPRQIARFGRAGKAQMHVDGRLAGREVEGLAEGVHRVLRGHANTCATFAGDAYFNPSLPGAHVHVVHSRWARRPISPQGAGEWSVTPRGSTA